MRREAARLAAGGGNDIDIELAARIGGERNELAVRRPIGAHRLLSIHGRELRGVGPIWIRNPDLRFSRTPRSKGDSAAVWRKPSVVFRLCGGDSHHRRRRGW